MSSEGGKNNTGLEQNTTTCPESNMQISKSKNPAQKKHFHLSSICIFPSLCHSPANRLSAAVLLMMSKPFKVDDLR